MHLLRKASSRLRRDPHMNVWRIMLHYGVFPPPVSGLLSEPLHLLSGFCLALSLGRENVDSLSTHNVSQVPPPSPHKKGRRKLRRKRGAYFI